jgi:hypothetical protein
MRRSTIRTGRLFVGVAEAVEGGLIEGPADEVEPHG